MFNATGDVDEDVDFNVTSTSSSKLANLFSFEAPKEQSLTYTAPKAPRKPEETKLPSGSAPAVICALVVHAYKFENQQYASRGKLGAAIIANHDNLSYKLVLYKGKQQHVTFATISLSFSFKVQSNKYGSFYDDQRDNWSVLFESEQNCSDFAKQVAVAKANSAGSSLNTVLIQDLTHCDETKGLEIGDSAEVKYSGWLLQNNTIGQLFDSNNGSDKVMKIKLGKSKVIKGWEEGMIGVKNKQKRLLVVPPVLGYGNQPVLDRIPANSTLIFEIFVTKVKSAKDASRSGTPISNQEQSDSLYVKKGSDPGINDSLPVSTVIGSVEESVKARGASISEQLSHSPKTEKAKIISRMAKMGTPMLPLQGSPLIQQSSESEPEDELVKRNVPSPARDSSPKPAIKPRATHPSVPLQTETQSVPPAVGLPQSTVDHHQIAIFQQYPNATGLPYGYSFQPTQPMPTMFTQHPAASLSSLTDSHLPILMSENRAQNSEVRMVLNKLGDKVDTVLNKLDQVKMVTHGGSQNMLPYMDSNTLLHNIERIVQENLKWKHELEEKTQKVHTLNEKICVLLEKNQRLVEESNNMMERRSETFQSSTAQSHSRLAILEQEKLKMSEELAAALSQISTLKLQHHKTQTEAQEKLGNVVDHSEKSRLQLEKLHQEINEKKDRVDELESSLSTAENMRKGLAHELEVLKQQCAGVQSSNESLTKVLKENEKEILKKTAEADDNIQMLKFKHEEDMEALKRKIHAEESSKQEQGVGSSFASNIWKDENEKLTSVVASSKLQIKELENQNAELVIELKNAKASVPVWEAKLKRSMTALYRSLQQEIENETTYNGEEVLQMVLLSIRSVTSAMLENKTLDNSTVPKSNVDSNQAGNEKAIDEDLNDINKTSDEENTSVTSDAQTESKVLRGNELRNTEVIKNDDVGILPETGSHTEHLSPEIGSTEVKNPISSIQVSNSSTKLESTWRPQPPPPPLFDDDDDDEDEDDWLKN